MAVIDSPEPMAPQPAALDRLRTALQANSLALLSQVLPCEVPVDLLPALLQHPLSEFRTWVWLNGGHQVLPTAISLLWQGHSSALASDYVQYLGTQYFYESYYYHTIEERELARQLVHTEFLWQLAPSLGYPNLKWAASASKELLTLALQNPQLDRRYIQRVCAWAESSPETEVESRLLLEGLAARQVAVQ
jgi:hypothetical protein